MTNLETIRNRIKFYIKDVRSTDEEINEVILQTIRDIANETKIFKKVNGFTVHKEKTLYDFRDITRMNEQTETEVSAVTIGSISREGILDWFEETGGQYGLPDPDVTKTTYTESEAESMFVDLLDIFDESGANKTFKFQYHGTAIYHVEDQDWLDENDDKFFGCVCTVIPHIDELLPEDIAYVMSAIIEGCKYHFADTLMTQEDAQVANLYYQRYWQKKQSLVNQFPTQVFSIKGRRVWP